MLIIVEGPDGAGKTRLARDLADHLPAAYINQRSRPQDEAAILLYTNSTIELAQDFIVVCDRYPLISDPIYDVAVRRMTSPKLGLNLEKSLLHSLREQDVIFIYCRPSIPDILDNVANSTQMVGVVANVRDLIGWYDERFRELEKEFDVRRYDYTKYGHYAVLCNSLRLEAQRRGTYYVSKEPQKAPPVGPEAPTPERPEQSSRDDQGQERRDGYRESSVAKGSNQGDQEESLFAPLTSERAQSWTRNVFEFHQKMKVPMNTRPTRLNHVNWEFRKRFLIEELNETMLAYTEKNMAAVADGLIDLCYVAIGTLLIMGVDPDVIWNRVQRANMSKILRLDAVKRGIKFVDSGRQHDSDVVKPVGWQPPNYDDITWVNEPLEAANGKLED